VLATTEPHKLPNTILSRCQRYDFKLVPASRLAQHLASIFKKEQLAIEAGAISLLVRESGGSVRDALSLSDQIISYVGDDKITEAHVAEVLGVADRSLTRTLVTSLATGEAGTALAAVESAIERGVDEVQLARAIVRYLRDLSVLQVAPDRDGLVDASDEERAELVAEAKQLERSRVTQMFDRMLRCCDELGKTLQPRLVLDCALIDVATIEPLIPLGDLLERLGELEGRLAGKGAVRPVAQRGTSGGGGDFKSTTPGTNVGPAKPPAPPVKVVSELEKTVEAAPPPAKPISESSGPVSMQPSGPVPKIETAASGSGPQDKLAATLPGVGPEVGAKPKLTTPESAPEALKMWERVIDYLETQRKLSLRGYCEFARIVKWTATELELGFASDSQGRWAGESLGEKQNVDELKAILAELGMKLKVEVRLLDDAQSTATPARSLAESTRASASAERNKRETEAREHPITKHVLQTFGASIKEIKTDV
jgi:DNA polymerase-3 subunit gamma/tau